MQKTAACSMAASGRADAAMLYAGKYAPGEMLLCREAANQFWLKCPLKFRE